MELYGFNGKKKKKKIWVIPACIAGAAVLCIFVLGIILSISSPERDTISAAVKENTELKQQISDLNTQVENLQAENDTLRAELDARPTAVPSPVATPAASAAATGRKTPRG